MYEKVVVEEAKIVCGCSKMKEKKINNDCGKKGIFRVKPDHEHFHNPMHGSIIIIISSIREKLYGEREAGGLYNAQVKLYFFIL
jgi:hypothetical protein